MVEKTSQNFLEFQSEREALSEVVAAKGEKKWRTVWFMRENCSNEADQNCLLCQRPQKTVGGEIFMLGRTTFLLFSLDVPLLEVSMVDFELVFYFHFVIIGTTYRINFVRTFHCISNLFRSLGSNTRILCPSWKVLTLVLRSVVQGFL